MFVRRRAPLRGSDLGRPSVYMTGSQWFSTTPGGLNRYFTDLYHALTRRDDVSVSAVAFGEAPIGAHTWGPSVGSTAARFRAAYFHGWGLPVGTVVDRHFCLYGRPSRVPGSKHPLVVHFHGPWSAEARIAGDSQLNARAKYVMERIRHARADRFIVLSQNFRQLLVEDYNVAEERVRVIPPGVDLERFRPDPVEEVPCDTPPGPRIVLCVRRLDPRMGIDVLLRAWRHVTSEVSDVRLVIVGAGNAKAALRAVAHEQGVESSVSFEGHVSDQRLTTLYRSSEFTVVPSVLLEGFGLIALESLAAGRAPIVTDCGGLPDAVQNLDESLIVRAGDATALAERIIAGLSGHLPSSRQCRAHAESFSWSHAADRHIALYSELAR